MQRPSSAWTQQTWIELQNVIRASALVGASHFHQELNTMKSSLIAASWI